MSTTSRHRVMGLLAAALLGGVACDDPPEERLAQARAAATDRDLTRFTSFFTRQSGALLRSLVTTAERTKITYLKEPFAVLPEGDLDEVTVEGQAAVLKVKSGKNVTEVRMFKENDAWAIDLYTLPALWAPLERGSP